MDIAVAEEYIEYYADKYNKLIKKHKFAMPLCKHIDENKLNNAIKTTYNIPAGYYITAKCIEDVERFAQNIHEKFGNKDGPFCTNEVLLRFSCMILNIFNRYLSYTFFH